jgi:manganese/iron transport system substrate-binding protein
MSTTSATRFVKHDPANAATYNGECRGLQGRSRRRSSRCAELAAIPEDKRWLVSSEGASAIWPATSA